MRDRQRSRQISVGRVKATKSSEALADVLREQILTGGYDEGSSLPSERDIVDETGLGRGSVREALRVLEVEGLIRTRTGRHGGAYTTRPDESGLTRFVSLFVRGRRVPMHALLEARTTIEPNLAYLAALNRTRADEIALSDACVAMEATSNSADFGRLNLAWHYCVAAASHNELLVAFLASIESAIAQGSEAHAKVFEADFEDIRPAVVRAHRAVTEAVVRGQADAAKRRMERHLNAYAATLADAESADVDVDVA
jgi:GntR family transcriptional repressor for pyruvate dehydrogenase complex